MPTALSIDSFVDLAKRSRLLSADKMEKVLQELESEGAQVDTPESLADALVDRGLLTRWQVGYLLKGKHHGFFLGPYRFLKMLGKGGMGAVYLAEHEMMRRRCAIKVLPSKLIDDSSSVLERFYLEAQAVAALDDPNIVRAYDVNKEVQGKREIHYLVMEYVDGCDLQVLVQRQGPLEYVQVADFTRQAASGLAHAHQCGLIHRDIKPANLLIDEQGTVKILDLGLARFFDDRLEASLTTTHNESILGTADYLSPEQALDSHNVDTRTDIYSLGCTCYFMLTGQPPFPDGSVAQRLMSHQSKSPTAIEKLRPDVPVDLVTMVEKMIAKSPGDRFQSAREVADAFGAWLAKHAEGDWKEKHRDVVDGHASRTRGEPTRARSAATEDTDLELGLAPSEVEDDRSTVISSQSSVKRRDLQADRAQEESLRIDQLEEIEPEAASLDASSSGGLDDLLNEALENYPALDSNPNLAVPFQSPSASGIQGTSKPAPRVSAESNQLLKLIVIGFAVSIPLAVVILFVSLRFSAPPRPTPPVAQSDLAGQVDSSDTAPVDSSPQVTSLPEPDASEPEIDVVATLPRVDSSEPVEPANPAEPEQTVVPQVPTVEQPATGEPETTPITTAAKVPSPASSTTASPVNTPPQPPSPSATAGDSNRGEPSDTEQSEPEPPSPERVKQLLAGLSVVMIQLDREPRNSYDLMVLKTAQESLERAGLKTTVEPQEKAASVLTLSFDAEKVDAFYSITMGAELKCRDEDANEVRIWKHQEEVATLRSSVLGSTPPTVLRRKVADFYGPLVRQYRQAVTASQQP